MAVTLRDIAKALNLSHATVSFVLNDRRDVAIPETTRQRVLEMAREMGYRPNRAARALVSGRTQMVAIWQPTPVTYSYGFVFDCLYSLLRQKGFETMFCQSAASHDEARAFEWPVDGIIGVDTYANHQEGREAPSIPYVSLGPYCDRRTDHINIDLFDASVEVVRHLVDQGCKNIVYLTPERERGDRRGRYHAYEKVATEVGQKVRVIRIASEDRDEVERAIQAEIAANGEFDGLFAYDDPLAMAAYGVLLTMGKKIPEDVAIVGFEDVPDAQYFPHPISSVHVPLQEACDHAIQILEDRIKDPRGERMSVTLKATFVPRGSSLRQG
jgi:DNA-binding LacI/PurR family transcriptional regulator